MNLPVCWASRLTPSPPGHRATPRIFRARLCAYRAPPSIPSPPSSPGLERRATDHRRQGPRNPAAAATGPRNAQVPSPGPFSRLASAFMARGQRCPACGRMTFQEQGQVRECSDSSCGAVGWLGSPKPSSARGKICQVCGSGTLKKVGDAGSLSIHHCYTCQATYLVPYTRSAKPPTKKTLTIESPPKRIRVPTRTARPR
jgi:hypothetical protein